MSRRTVLCCGATALLVLLALSASRPLSPVPALATANPCQYITTEPPRGGTGPLIGGRITNAQSAGPISGATVELYRCVNQAGVYVTATTTDTEGDYAFTSMAEEHYYYVEAVLTGSLSGMEPAGGTENPTPAIAVGDGNPDMDLSFQ